MVNRKDRIQLFQHCLKLLEYESGEYMIPVKKNNMIKAMKILLHEAEVEPKEDETVSKNLPDFLKPKKKKYRGYVKGCLIIKKNPKSKSLFYQDGDVLYCELENSIVIEGRADEFRDSDTIMIYDEDKYNKELRDKLLWALFAGYAFGIFIFSYLLFMLICFL